MKILKTIPISLIVFLVLAALVRYEHTLEQHYDTLQYRDIKTISIISIPVKKSVELRDGSYRLEYEKIYGEEPDKKRWYSVSRRPLEEVSIFGGMQWSIVSSRGSLVRDEIAENIFKRYQQDRSVEQAKQAFQDLERLLPSNESLKNMDHDKIDQAISKAKVAPSLAELCDDLIW